MLSLMKKVKKGAEVEEASYQAPDVEAELESQVNRYAELLDF